MTEMDRARPPQRPPRRDDELRLFGLNACLAAFRVRPDELRKVYLLRERMGVLREVLAHCAARRIGYRIVGDQDLRKLTGSQHHEGVCFDVRQREELLLSRYLQHLTDGPAMLVWLDGVGNPHNLGAVLRSAAHFSAGAVLVPATGGALLSGAACRVAEGGAEHVPVIAMRDAEASAALLAAAGFRLVATLPSRGDDVFSVELPERLVWVFGAEQRGMSDAALARCSLRCSIPGSGVVESLNIANAAAVLLAEWRRRHPLG